MKTTFESKFSVGEKAYTVDKSTMRIIEFEVAQINVDSDADGTRTYLYPFQEDGKIAYRGYTEKDCFPSREALQAHLDGNDDNNTPNIQ